MAKVTLRSGGKLSIKRDQKTSKREQDIRELADDDRIALDNYLQAENIPFDLLAQNSIASATLRTYMEAKRYLDREATINAQLPIRFHPQGFLNKKQANKQAICINKFCLYLTLGNTPPTYAAIAKAKGTNVLKSYFALEPPNRETKTGKLADHITVLRNFLYDPVATVSSTPSYKRYWDIMEAALNAK